VHLATHAGELAELRARLMARRDSAPLFDTLSSTAHLEAAYAAIHERSMRGEPPADIVIEATAGR
jgi:predicted O-linked N-acetylglucosamine transferase (SPINDLY family)